MNHSFLFFILLGSVFGAPTFPIFPTLIDTPDVDRPQSANLEMHFANETRNTFGLQHRKHIWPTKPKTQLSNVPGNTFDHQNRHAFDQRNRAIGLRKQRRICQKERRNTFGKQNKQTHLANETETHLANEFGDAFGQPNQKRIWFTKLETH